MSSESFLIVGREQSCLAFCDLMCFNTFTVYQDTSEMREARSIKKVRLACYYCAGCGRIVNKPTLCMLHDDDCPDYLWFSSYPTMYDFMEEWEAQFGDFNVNEYIWEVADSISRANPLISGVDLAQLTIRNLGY